MGNYAAPSSLNYFWSFGSLAGLSLVLQIITGLFLAQHYIPEETKAFDSLARVLLHVPYGWMVHGIHVNGATMFFAVLYIHVAKNIYRKTYATKRLAWFTGLALFLLLMATAFTGYILPWGQMSFWGATVITNFISTIPVVGIDIAIWFWGGFTVDGDTLNRFFVIHYFLPFVMCGVIILHLLFLHEKDVVAPHRSTKFSDKIQFASPFVVKDAYLFWVYIFILWTLACLYPDMFRHPENFIKANPMVTPSHIVPEWYFLPFYAILRSVPDKLGGLALMLLSIFMFFIVPFIDAPLTEGTVTGRIHKVLFIVWCNNFFVLTAMGAKPIVFPYIEIARVSTVLHIYIILIAFPFLSYCSGKYFDKAFKNE